MRCVYKGVTSTFKYGADGLRRQATVNGVTTDYVYDGQTLIREGFASGGTLSTVKATYLQGPRGSECRIDETNQTEGYYRFDATGAVIKNAQGQPIVFARGVTKWYVYDGLGSVVGEVDPSGNLTSSPKYDVYGLVRANPGTASSAMGFVGGLGHLSEAGTGLIYMRARYYDPALGRFASEDPGASGENWFIYCNDNPVNFVDATGTTPGEEELFTELLEKVLSAFDYMSGIKAQEWIAEKVGGGFDKFYTRIFGESPFEQITKADPNAADAGTDELMVEYEVESKVQVDNVQSAGKVGTEVVIKADEEDAL